MTTTVKDVHLKLVDVAAFANVDIGSFVTACQVRQQLEQHISNVYLQFAIFLSDASPIIAWPCE